MFHLRRTILLLCLCFVAAIAQAADYYAELEISRDADIMEIKKGYRRLSNKYHPDQPEKPEGYEKKFMEITHAYEVLSNEELRDVFDEKGYEGLQEHYRNGFPNHLDYYFLADKPDWTVTFPFKKLTAVVSILSIVFVFSHCCKNSKMPRGKANSKFT